MTTATEFLTRWHSLPEALKSTSNFDARKALIRYCQGFVSCETAIQTAEMNIEAQNLQGRKDLAK